MSGIHLVALHASQGPPSDRKVVLVRAAMGPFKGLWVPPMFEVDEPDLPWGRDHKELLKTYGLSVTKPQRRGVFEWEGAPLAATVTVFAGTVRELKKRSRHFEVHGVARDGLERWDISDLGRAVLEQSASG